MVLRGFPSARSLAVIIFCPQFMSPGARSVFHCSAGKYWMRPQNICEPTSDRSPSARCPRRSPQKWAELEEVEEAAQASKDAPEQPEDGPAAPMAECALPASPRFVWAAVSHVEAIR